MVVDKSLMIAGDLKLTSIGDNSVGREAYQNLPAIGGGSGTKSLLQKSQ